MPTKRTRKPSTDQTTNQKMPSFNLNLRNFVLALAILASIYLFFVTIGPQGITSARGQMNSGTDTLNLKNINLRASALPVESFKGGQKAPGVNVNEMTITVPDSNVNIHYRISEPAFGVEPSGKVLFLLHGAAFSSKTWVNEIGTMQTMASVGHKVIAVDLPGYGQSGRFSGDKGEFLEKLIQELAPNSKPVLVSPSMSGSFSLPLLERNPDLICGYIPVAPVSTGSYSKDFYQSLKVPTMIIYGSKDTGLGVTSAQHLREISTSTDPQILENARHPAYLDQPDVWHQLIYNFMLALSC